MATTQLILGPESAILGSSAPGVSYTAGTNFTYMTLDFDQSTAEKCYFIAPLVQAYGGGNISAKIYWTASATGNVVWGIKYLGRVDDEVLDSALSSQSTVTDSVTAANDLMVATVTLSSPSLAGGDLLILELSRVAGDAGDTLAADAKFLGMALDE